MLTVATLNIWNRFGPWDERLPAIRARLSELLPDILGLQEVLRSRHGDRLDQVDLVSRGLGYHAAWGLASETHEGFPVGNAILSRFPIVRSETFALPDGGSDERRSLVFAEIDAPCGRLAFFVTHLNWKLHHGHIRCAQVRFIAAAIERVWPIDGGGFPPIIVGDFNAEPDSDEIRFMRGLTGLGGPCVYFADAFGASGDGSPGITFARRNPFAATVHEPDRRIDYVFVRGPDDRYRGEPLSARVCFDTPVDGTFPSDHFGVVATLST